MVLTDYDKAEAQQALSNRPIGGRSLNAAAEQVTPFHAVMTAHEELTKLEGRLYQLTAKLVGGYPQSGEKAVTDAPQPAGVLNELRIVGSRMSAMVRRAHESIDAIERHLP